VFVDNEVCEKYDADQQALIDKINDGLFDPRLDVSAYVVYPRGHEFFGSALDQMIFEDGFGEEHSGEWRKGYAVLRLWETDVGLRLYY
jgi:hypothetical protein